MGRCHWPHSAETNRAVCQARPPVVVHVRVEGSAEGDLLEHEGHGEVDGQVLEHRADQRKHVQWGPCGGVDAAEHDAHAAHTDGRGECAAERSMAIWEVARRAKAAKPAPAMAATYQQTSAQSPPASACEP